MTRCSQIPKQPLRVLLVDDSVEWREKLRSLLKTRPEWNIMQPDIILLDVGMPCLNGIEAAKIIRRGCPQSKILFVTQDGDADIRNAAMRVGAAAYVLKANSGSELLEAITTALYR